MTVSADRRGHWYESVIRMESRGTRVIRMNTRVNGKEIGATSESVLILLILNPLYIVFVIDSDVNPLYCSVLPIGNIKILRRFLDNWRSRWLMKYTNGMKSLLA